MSSERQRTRVEALDLNANVKKKNCKKNEYHGQKHVCAKLNEQATYMEAPKMRVWSLPCCVVTFVPPRKSVLGLCTRLIRKVGFTYFFEYFRIVQTSSIFLSMCLPIRDTCSIFLEQVCCDWKLLRRVKIRCGRPSDSVHVAVMAQVRV